MPRTRVGQVHLEQAIEEHGQSWPCHSIEMFIAGEWVRVAVVLGQRHMDHELTAEKIREYIDQEQAIQVRENPDEPPGPPTVVLTR